jgi:hypothetical protein
MDGMMNTEPVAHFYPEGEGCTVYDIQFAWKVTGTTEPIPLYTHPTKTLELTRDEIRDVWRKNPASFTLTPLTIEFARAILRKAQEK